MNEYEFHSWRVDALCAQIGSNLFFLNRGEPGIEAKRACGMCPVRLQCLADAIGEDCPEDGIFGGFGRDARRAMSKRVTPRIAARDVAREAIEEESNVRRLADHRGRDQRPRRRGRLLEAAGREEERPDLAALGAGAA